MSIEAVLARGALVLIALAGAYLAALWFVLAVWTFRDIEARSRSVVTQIFATLLVVLFFVPGVLLYMILRPKATLDETFQRSLEEEYLLQDLEELPLCPGCQHYVEDDFVLCPHCHAQLREPCAGCARMVDLRWARCPYCGDARNAPTVEIRERVAEPAARWVAPAVLRRRANVAAGEPVPPLTEPAGEPAALPAREPAAIASTAAEAPPAVQATEPTPFPVVRVPRTVPRPPEPTMAPAITEADERRVSPDERGGPVALPRVRASIHRNGNGHGHGHAEANGTAPAADAAPTRAASGNDVAERIGPRGQRHDLERLETLARMATGEYRQAMDDANPEALPDVARGDRE